MQNKGMLWASDRAEWRLQKLKRRTGPGESFQLSFGVLGWRHEAADENEIRRRARGRAVQRHRNVAAQSAGALDDEPKDVRELSAIQKNLLANVAPSVKPGGKLIFSVCTLSRAETTEVVEHFNASQPDFEPLIVQR